MGSTHVNVSDKRATSSTPPSASVLQSEIDGGPLYQRHPPDNFFSLFKKETPSETNPPSRGTVTDNY